MDKIKLSPSEPALDPLKRIFVPIEKRTTIGRYAFRTTDNQRYERRGDGSIRREVTKVRGKAARRADKKLRQHAND